MEEDFPELYAAALKSPRMKAPSRLFALCDIAIRILWQKTWPDFGDSGYTLLGGPPLVSSRACQCCVKKILEDSLMMSYPIGQVGEAA
jgi:hypothetical protein